jgi:mono/diheme cytochrome c family protein
MRNILLSGLLFSGLAFAQGKGDAAKGKALFEEKAEPVCGVCHNADNTEKKMGPGLKGLYTKGKLKNGKKPSDASVKEIIVKGGGGMPGYEDTLKPADMDNLLAYLRTL